MFHANFHHQGQFLKGKYTGGKSTIVFDVEPDLFSYTVLMELVKDDLHYTEIGGVYINQQGGWKLLTDDKDVCKYIEAAASGSTMDFYVDNIIDKEIEPLKQMQPHVVVRPRPNVFKGKTQPAKTFVTIQDYQKQQKNAKKRGQQGNDVNKSSARRKLSLDNDVTKHSKKSEKQVQVQENEGNEDVHDVLPRLTKYEEMQRKRVAEVKDVMKSMGLIKMKEELTVKGSKGKTKVGAIRNNLEEGTDEYNPADASEVDASEEESVHHVTKKKRTKMLGAGPTTRSRANPTVTTEKENEVTKSVPLTQIAEENEVTEQPLQRPIVVGNGSMAAFLQMRAQKRSNEAKKVVEKDVPDVDLAENAIQEIEKEVRKRRYRGVTRMDKVHARKPSDKKLITLNERFQPVTSQKKVRAELSNFLGTIARRYVPLNYVNWPQVPDTEKDAYWGLVLDRYIIPEEARDWVMRTICDLWRLHKSRVKANHYTAYDNDEDMIANKPDKIPLEEFKALLEYWADEHTQTVATKNSENRRKISDTHTAGTTSFAQISNEMKLKHPEQVSPKKARVYIETRKRNPKKEYKTSTDAIKNKISDIEKLISSNGESDTVDQLFCEAEPTHGPTWLVGRHIKTAKEKEKNVGHKDNNVNQLKAEIREELAAEMEEQVNTKVQENLRKIFKKLGESNPSFNLQVEELYTSNSSDGENGTPMTQPTPMTQQTPVEVEGTNAATGASS